MRPTASAAVISPGDFYFIFFCRENHSGRQSQTLSDTRRFHVISDRTTKQFWTMITAEYIKYERDNNILMYKMYCRDFNTRSGQSRPGV